MLAQQDEHSQITMQRHREIGVLATMHVHRMLCIDLQLPLQQRDSLSWTAALLADCLAASLQPNSIVICTDTWSVPLGTALISL